MAKKAKKAHHKGAARRAAGMAAMTDRALRLAEQYAPEVAVERLEGIAEQRPRDPAAQLAYALVLREAGQLHEAAEGYRRTLALAPGEGALYNDLGLLYAHLDMPIHAARSFRAYIPYAPPDRVEPTRDIAAAVAPTVAQASRDLQLDAKEAEEAVYWMHEGLYQLQREEGDAALDAAERALRIAPRFTEALNNQAAALVLLGRLDEAAAVSRHVLEDVDPRNRHALMSLVRTLVFAGKREEALSYQQRLRDARPAGGRHLEEPAYGLAWLGDDEGVYRALKALPKLSQVGERLLAVAALNLGKKDEARRLWQALGNAPDMGEEAKQALEHLRSGEDWRLPYFRIPEAAPRAVLGRTFELACVVDQGNASAHRDLRELVERFPQLITTLEVMLGRSSEAEGALTVLERIGTPRALDVMRRFVSSRDGSDAARHAAGRTLLRLGVIGPDDPIRYWAGGKYTDILFRVIDVVDEPYDFPDDVAEAYERARTPLRERRPAEALPLLEDLVRRYPDVAAFRNDLGAAYSLLGRDDEGVAERLKAVELDPKYPFARINLAHRALDRGDVEGAKAWIEPVAWLPRMSPGAYSGVMHVQARLLLRDGERERARKMLEMIREVAPDGEAARALDQELRNQETYGLLSSAFGRFVEMGEKRQTRAREKRRAKLPTRDPALADALGVYDGGDLSEIRRALGILGASALRKAELASTLAARLRDPGSFRHLLDDLPEDERQALGWLVESGGSAPLSGFAERFRQDPNARPNLRNPTTLLSRLAVKALAIETLVAGTPFVAVPVELREPARRWFAGETESDDPGELELKP